MKKIICYLFASVAILQLPQLAKADDAMNHYRELSNKLHQNNLSLKSQVETTSFPLSTEAVSVIEEALVDKDYINAVCQSLNGERRKRQCLTGPFAFSNELLGLKNCIKIYNENKSPYVLHMLVNDISFVELYIKQFIQD